MKQVVNTLIVAIILLGSTLPAAAGVTGGDPRPAVTNGDGVTGGDPRPAEVASASLWTVILSYFGF